MDIKLINEKEEPILSRKVSTFAIEFSNKTPAKDEVKKTIVAQLKVNEDVVALKKIAQEFGQRKATATVYVYKDAKSLKQFEEINKKKKKEGEQKPAAPQEEKKPAEKPAEKKPKGEESGKEESKEQKSK